MHACVIIFIALAASFVSGAKILALFPTPSISHQIVYRNLMLELNKKGHDLTIMTTDPIKNPKLKNYKEIDVGFSYDYMRKKFDYSSDDNRLIRWFPEIFLLVSIEVVRDFCEMYMSHEEMKGILERDEKFDLLIVEWGIAPCMYAYSRQTNNTMMGIISLQLGSMAQIAMGSTSNPAYVPEIGFDYTDRMTFPQRLRNTVFHLAAFAYVKYTLYDHDRVVKKYFGSDMPSLFDIEREVSLILTNTHFSNLIPRPNVPNVIPIGGPPFHLLGKSPNPLPKDIQEFLDDAKEGVIYFSLGSNVKSSTMPESKRAVFLEAFKQIKQKVLWKWETDDLPGKPDNVKLGKWLPQTDILAHPNIKLFITQGGLQSMGEATHYEIPMIVIPFFADQELNAKKLVSVGVAIRLDFETMTTEELLSAINEVIHNKEYKKNMEKYSALTKDQPQSPMERAVWWTEYVLRHNGARHLRSAAVDMPWYQYFLLDVIAFLSAVALIAIYVIYLIVRVIARLIFGKSKKAKKE